VRDAALGREVTDADLVVSGSPADASTAIARETGGPRFRLSEEFDTWRVGAPDGRWHVDVTPVRGGGIAGDLGLRDFTVNAMALPLSGLDGEVLDPVGGLADLESRMLRAVSERSFEDDPLRLVRAARIGAALGLEVEAGTAALARASASRAGEPAGERQLAELRLLLGGSSTSSVPPRLSCPSSRRFAASSRTPTITSTSTATRSPCWSGCWMWRPTWAPTPASARRRWRRCSTSHWPTR
jgi:tRNA nucleotidyltransferase/poly(A) polymerase